MSIIGGILSSLLFFSFMIYLGNKFYSRASSIVLRKTRTSGERIIYSIFPMFELINFDRLKRIRVYLNEEEYNEKKLLRAAINGELGRLKHFAPMGIIITLVVTMFLAIFSNIIPLISNWSGNFADLAIQQKIKALEEKGVNSNEIANALITDFEMDIDFAQLLSNRMNSELELLLKWNIEFFISAVLVLILYWIYYQIRLSRLLKLKYIIDEVISNEEKTSINIITVSELLDSLVELDELEKLSGEMYRKTK